MKHIIFAMILLSNTASAASLFIDLGLSAHRDWSGKHDSAAMPYDADKIANPYAYVAAGIISNRYAWGEYVTFTHRFELSHESSIATGKDRGVDAARWVLRLEFN